MDNLFFSLWLAFGLLLSLTTYALYMEANEPIECLTCYVDPFPAPKAKP